MMMPMLLMSSGGNSKYSAFISILVMIVTSLFSEFLASFNLNKMIQKALQSKNKHRKTVLKLKAVISSRNMIPCDWNLGLNYNGVMHYLYKTITADKNTTIDYHIKDSYQINSTSLFNDVKIVIFESNEDEYPLTDDIMISMEITNGNSGNDNNMTYEIYTLKLRSISNNINSIEEFIKEAVRIYDLDRSIQHLRMFQIVNMMGNDKAYPDYAETKFESTKTFDNMFF
jgi:hypothetical protein